MQAAVAPSAALRDPSGAADAAPARGARHGPWRLHWRDPNTQFLALAVLVGLLGAAVAIVFRALTHGLTSLLTGEENIVEAARTLPLAALILMPAAGGLVGGFIARRFVRTGGTMGIAQIMEVVAVGRRTVKVRQSLARTASSLIVIATGGSEGREGPIIQMAAAFASGIARVVKVSPERTQMLVACGMAAGVAGAYNAPISATLFVLELIVGSFSMSLLGPVVVSAVISSVVTRAVLGDAPLYHVPSFTVTSPQQHLLYAPIGVLAGIGSVFFMRALRLAKRAFHATGWRDEYRMMLGGAGVGVIGLWFADVWGNGFEGTNHVLSSNWTIAALAALCIAKVLATGLTIGSGGVGGVFTPALMVGATLGAIAGTAAKSVFPHLDAPVFACALLGMGGLLAGTTRAPFLAIIMMFELTDAPAVVLPMMIVAVLAVLGARIFERESIYVEELRESGVHWQGTPQGTALTTLRVSEIMRTDASLLPPSLSYDAMIDAFLESRAPHIYIGSPDGRLLGVVDLHDLQQAMRAGDLSGLVVASDVMREIPFVLPDESIASVNEKLWLRDFGHLPVVESAATRRFLGIVTRRDILGALDREILGRSALMAKVSRVSKAGQEIDYLELPEKHRLATIDVDQRLAGRTLAEADLRRRHGITVLAVSRLELEGTVRRFVPDAQERLRRGDHLIVLAPEDCELAFGGDAAKPA